jgi:hypothetical protein
MFLASSFPNLDTRYQYPLYLCLLAGLLFFAFLGARDFWAPVEPRYAEIARVMFSKGEWIVPTVNGDLYTDKPILYFWIVLIASKIFGGVSEWTVRLPAALGGLPFLIERLAFGTVDEAFENERTILDASESARRDRQIVAHEIEFRELRLLRKIQLLGMGHLDLAPLDRQDLGCVSLQH